MHLPPRLVARIEVLMVAGDFPDPEAVIAAALLLLEERDRRRARLLELLAEGEEDIRLGNVAEYTSELREQIRQSAHRRALAGETPSPHVCP